MATSDQRRRDFLKLSAAAGSALVASSAIGPAAARGRADKIVRYAVHPAIGIARVGNSLDDYYLAPELPASYPIRPAASRTRAARSSARRPAFASTATTARRGRARDHRR